MSRQFCGKVSRKLPLLSVATAHAISRNFPTNISRNCHRHESQLPLLSVAISLRLPGPDNPLPVVHVVLPRPEFPPNLGRVDQTLLLGPAQLTGYEQHKSFDVLRQGEMCIPCKDFN